MSSAKRWNEQATKPREMSDADFLVWMAGYAEDHDPEGWPAVQMWEITRLVEIATQRTGEGM